MKKFSEEEFKEKLDVYLQKLPDQPKIDGLIPWWQDQDGKPSNSIQFQVASKWVSWEKARGLREESRDKSLFYVLTKLEL